MRKWENHKTLNLGCGYLKIADAINLDIDERCNPDVVHNVTKGIPYPDNTFEKVFASQVLEHIFDWEALMIEIHRVMKLGGLFYASVPMWPSRNSYAGGGHIRQFVPESFLMFTDPRFYQPKCHVCESQGLFEKVDMNAEKVEMENDVPGAWITNLEVVLEKVDKKYWQEKGVTKLLTTEVVGCFWCKHELKKVTESRKVCPNCDEVYTFDGILKDKNEM